MSHIISTILAIVLLGLTIQGLDARKINSQLNRVVKRADQRHQKRQIVPLSLTTANYFGNYQSPCNFAVSRTCDEYITGISNSGSQLQRAISVAQKHNYFVNGLVSLLGLRDGGMCMPRSSLLTASGFTALGLGHMTLPQLATLRIFPMPSVDINALLDASYIHTFDQVHVLSPLGLQASISGHILTSQLQTVNAYPLQGSALNYDFLMQAKYITSDCIPTALGIAALHINYFQSSSLESLGCPNYDNSQFSMAQLTTADYIFGSSGLITPVGFAAVRARYVNFDIFRKLGLFPFGVGLQVQSSDNTFQDQPQQPSVDMNDLVHLGYIQSSTYFLTSAAHYAMLDGYFTIDILRNLNLWPCPGTPSMETFIAAGYAVHSGHLTTLGASLSHAHYFPSGWLTQLGIHMNDDFNVYSHALSYGGYIQSGYHAVHSSVRSEAAYSKVETSQQVVQSSQTVGVARSVGVASGVDTSNVAYRSE